MADSERVEYSDNGLTVTADPGHRVVVTLDGDTVFDAPWAGGATLTANRQAFSALTIVQNIGSSEVPAARMHLPGSGDLIAAVGQDRVRQAHDRFEALRWTIPQ